MKLLTERLWANLWSVANLQVRSLSPVPKEKKVYSYHDLRFYMLLCVILFWLANQNDPHRLVLEISGRSQTDRLHSKGTVGSAWMLKTFWGACDGRATPLIWMKAMMDCEGLKHWAAKWKSVEKLTNECFSSACVNCAVRVTNHRADLDLFF